MTNVAALAAVALLLIPGVALAGPAPTPPWASEPSRCSTRSISLTDIFAGVAPRPVVVASPPVFVQPAPVFVRRAPPVVYHRAHGHRCHHWDWDRHR
jgi:hypothetical protein